MNRRTIAILCAFMGCMPADLDERGRDCKDTCPSGLPCVSGVCGGEPAPEPIDAGDAGKDGPPPSDSGNDAPVDAGPPLQMYTYLSQIDQWSHAPLRNYWSGPNAPPERGITAATKFIDHDRLLVFADDGMFYLRADGAWRAPVPIAQVWAPLAKAPNGITHIPQKWRLLIDSSAGDFEGIIIVVNPMTYNYKYNPNDTVEFQGMSTIDQGDAGIVEPAQTGKMLWSYEIFQPTNDASAERYQFWDLYDDGNLYEVNVAFAIKRWKLAESPFWVGHPDAPAANGVAAYSDYDTGIVYIVGP